MAKIKTIRRYQNRSPYRRGLVLEQDVPNVKVRVRFTDRDQMQSFWLAVGQRGTQDDKDFWMPDVGEQVACLMDDHDEDGVVMYAIYSKVDTPPTGMTADKRHITFKDGTQLEYDRSSHVLDAKLSDGAEIKYDATAHAFSANLPSGATHTVNANGATIQIDASGNILLSPGALVKIAGGGPAIARVGDTVVCPAGNGSITTGSAKAECGG